MTKALIAVNIGGQRIDLVEDQDFYFSTSAEFARAFQSGEINPVMPFLPKAGRQQVGWLCRERLPLLASDEALVRILEAYSAVAPDRAESMTKFVFGVLHEAGERGALFLLSDLAESMGFTWLED